MDPKKWRVPKPTIRIYVWYSENSCVRVVCVKYNLMMRSGITLSVTSTFALLVVLNALLRAPEGYEDESGFHIGVLADAAPL